MSTSFDQIDTKLINLNSNDAILNNGTLNSDVTFNFSNILKEEEDITHSTISILSAQIPVSFYCINANNNLLTIQYGSTSQLITITPGNYNANSLITELTNRFLSYSFNITIVINVSTGGLAFTSGTTLQFKMVGSTCQQVLGFNSNITSNGSNVLVMPFPLNLLGSKRLTIKSPNLTCNNTYNSTSNSDSGCIGCIPVDVASWALINYSNFTRYELILRQTIVSQINITIIDEYGLVNFNNSPWTMTLQLNIYRKKIKNDATFQSALQNINKELAVIENELKPADETQVIQPKQDQPNFNEMDNNPDVGDLDLLLYNHQI